MNSAASPNSHTPKIPAKPHQNKVVGQKNYEHERNTALKYMQAWRTVSSTAEYSELAASTMRIADEYCLEQTLVLEHHHEFGGSNISAEIQQLLDKYYPARYEFYNLLSASYHNSDTDSATEHTMQSKDAKLLQQIRSQIPTTVLHSSWALRLYEVVLQTRVAVRDFLQSLAAWSVSYTATFSSDEALLHSQLESMKSHLRASGEGATASNVPSNSSSATPNSNHNSNIVRGIIARRHLRKLEQNIDIVLQRMKEAAGRPNMISEHFVCSLYSMLSAKPETALFRTTDRPEEFAALKFPVASLVQEYLANALRQANYKLHHALEHPFVDPFSVAARVSFDVVRIAPFPQYNGVVSRLLAGIVLQCFGVPFVFAPAGDTKGRHRYEHSLEKMYQNKPEQYTSLLVSETLVQFQRLEQELIARGKTALIQHEEE